MAFAAGMFGLEPASQAHGLDAGRSTLELEGSVLRVVATPRSRAFPWADSSGDGLLDRGEVRAHRPALREAFERAFVVTDERGALPVCSQTDVSTPGDGGPVDHIRITRICRFEHAPAGLLLKDELVGDFPVQVDALRARKLPEGGWSPEGPIERVSLLGPGASQRLLWTLPADAPAAEISLQEVGARRGWWFALALGAALVLARWSGVQLFQERQAR